ARDRVRNRVGNDIEDRCPQARRDPFSSGERKLRPGHPPQNEHLAEDRTRLCNLFVLRQTVSSLIGGKRAPNSPCVEQGDGVIEGGKEALRGYAEKSRPRSGH